jgi:hypothetical protein
MKVDVSKHVLQREPSLLGVYLNDHLTGATAGVDLAGRLASSFRGTPHGPALAQVAQEVEADRASLRRIMERLDVPVNYVKAAAGWAGEKAARLKPNGRLLRRSPLSDVVELETMALGVRGKIEGWQTLGSVAAFDDRLDAAELDRLRQRAERQLDVLDGIRRDVVGPAFREDHG